MEFPFYTICSRPSAVCYTRLDWTSTTIPPTSFRATECFTTSTTSAIPIWSNVTLNIGAPSIGLRRHQKGRRKHEDSFEGQASLYVTDTSYAGGVPVLPCWSEKRRLCMQYLVVIQTMLVRCPKNLDFTVFQKVSLPNLIFWQAWFQENDWWHWGRQNQLRCYKGFVSLRQKLHSDRPVHGNLFSHQS